MKELLVKVANEKSVRGYCKESDSTEVVTLINHSIMSAEEKKDSFYNSSLDIAKRLLKVEMKVEDRLNHMSHVKKGCLIQALMRFNDEPSKYRYLLAKVENKKFVDASDLEFKNGFSIDSDKVWKFCIFEIWVMDDDLMYDNIDAFVDTKAKYWTEDFLEIKELKSDEKNTKVAFNSVDYELKKFQKKYPSDGLLIRNTIILNFRNCTKQLNYTDMIEDVLGTYIPISSKSKDIEDLKQKLLELPEKKSFDTQFIPSLSAIKARIRQKYKVNEEVEILAKQGLSNIKDTVYSEETIEGEKRLIIKITDNNTFDIFKVK